MKRAIAFHSASPFLNLLKYSTFVVPISKETNLVSYGFVTIQSYFTPIKKKQKVIHRIGKTKRDRFLKRMREQERNNRV